MRVLGGELLKVTVANDGSRRGAPLEPGAAVTLHLPPDGLRVLLPSVAPETPDEPEAEPMIDPARAEQLKPRRKAPRVARRPC